MSAILHAAAKQDQEGPEQAWSEEISHRIQELDSGKAQTLPWEEVSRRISTKLGDGR